MFEKPEKITPNEENNDKKTDQSEKEPLVVNVDVDGNKNVFVGDMEAANDAAESLELKSDAETEAEIEAEKKAKAEAKAAEKKEQGYDPYNKAA